MGTSGETENNKKLIIIAIAVAVLMGVLTILAWPYVKQLNDPEIRARFTGWIESLGIWGVLILLGIQFIQIVIAFIPGGPIEIVAGAAYGALGGLLICIAGSVAASSLIFAVVRKFGVSLVNRLFKKEKLDKFKFLQNTKRIERLSFILFLIPGTPKDMLTYAAGLSRIPMLRFILIANFARIPAILAATMMGDSMVTGRWYVLIPVFIVTAVIGILGITYQDRIIRFLSRNQNNEDSGGE